MFTESKGCFARPVACSKSWTKFVPCTNNCVKHVNACVNRKMNYNPGQNHWDNWRTVNPDIEFIFVNWNPPHPNQCWWSFVPSQVSISLFKPTLVRRERGDDVFLWQSRDFVQLPSFVSRCSNEFWPGL